LTNNHFSEYELIALELQINTRVILHDYRKPCTSQNISSKWRMFRYLINTRIMVQN